MNEYLGVILLESSTSWPQNTIAIKKIKNAFYLELSELLLRQVKKSTNKHEQNKHELKNYQTNINLNKHKHKQT